MYRLIVYEFRNHRPPLIDRRRYLESGAVFLPCFSGCDNHGIGSASPAHGVHILTGVVLQRGRRWSHSRRPFFEHLTHAHPSRSNTLRRSFRAHIEVLGRLLRQLTALRYTHKTARPWWTVSPCGKGNRFESPPPQHHPAPATYARLVNFWLAWRFRMGPNYQPAPPPSRNVGASKRRASPAPPVSTFGTPSRPPRRP